MKKQLILALCCAFCSSAIKAQSETDGLVKSDSSINMLPVEQKSLLLRDSTYPKFATMNLKPNQKNFRYSTTTQESIQIFPKQAIRVLICGEVLRLDSTV